MDSSTRWRPPTRPQHHRHPNEIDASCEWDGREIARHAWSLFGLGELHGTVDVDGRPHDVHLTLSVGSGPGEGFLTDGRCTVSVDGAPVETRHIR
jgi:hypothetical protein